MKLMGHSSGVVGVVCSVALISSAQADTIFVDDDNCPGPGDGSELDPYCSIQTAIDNAVDTDEIVVATGTTSKRNLDFAATHLPDCRTPLQTRQAPSPLSEDST